METGAKDRILYLLKTKGPQTAAELAKRLEMTPVGARQHLGQLADEGMLVWREERRGVGRPRRVYTLTSAAESRFPETYADLALELLGSVTQAFGEEGLDSLIRARTREQVRRYRERVPSDAGVGDKVKALARIRREEGYLAESRATQDGAFLLIENHCPICAAAKVCQGLCASEMDVFRAVLGKSATIERTEHIVAGARRCVYRVEGRVDGKA